MQAAWLGEHLPGTRGLDLLAEPEDPARRIVPQLREVAGRLAAVDDVLREHLLAQDPVLVLRYAADASDHERAALVDGLLGVAADRHRELSEPGATGAFSSLAHPGLAAQLEDPLRDPTAPPTRRQIAARIAGRAGVGACAPALLDLALGHVPGTIDLRIRAVEALVAIATPTQRAALFPLALDRIDEDTDDELKAATLSALWPDDLSADKLFSALTPPRDARSLGTYSMFLRRRLPESLGPDDLPAALRYAAANNVPYADSGPAELARKVLDQGWIERHHPEVFDPLVLAIRESLVHHGDVLGQGATDLLNDDDDRRRILAAVVADIASDHIAHGAVQRSTPPLLRADDLTWLLEQLDVASATTVLTWAQLAYDVWDRSDPAQTQQIYDAAQRHEVLRAGTAHCFGAWPLDSPAATAAHHRAEEERAARAERAAQTPAPSAPLDDLLEATLTEAESGDVSAWDTLSWQVADDLSASRRYDREVRELFTTSPGWLGADGDRRDRILAAARAYLDGFAPPDDDWLARSQIPRPVIAGVRAMELLWETDPTWILSRAPEFWDRWASALVGLPRNGDDGEEVSDALKLQAAEANLAAMQEAVLTRARGHTAHRGNA